MHQTSEEFFEKMVTEEQPEAAGNTFAEKMAELDKKIAERIDQVEKNLLNSMQPQLQEEAPEESEDLTEEQTEETPEENNEGE